MIQFGTGGWRAVIGDGFTRGNIRLIAAALAAKMKREGCAEQGLCVGYGSVKCLPAQESMSILST